MSWFKPRREKPLREQLVEARESLIRQIAILDTGPLKFEPGATDYMAHQAAELRETLAGINAELARMDSADS